MAKKQPVVEEVEEITAEPVAPYSAEREALDAKRAAGSISYYEYLEAVNNLAKKEFTK